MRNLLIILLLFTSLSCKKFTENSFEVSDLQITWSVIENLGGTYSNGWKISNQGNSTLPSSGWAIYYNHVVGVPIPESISGSLSVTQISGTFYKITPTESFTELGQGESASLMLECIGSGIKITDAPSGLYMVVDAQAPEVIQNFKIGPFPPDELMKRSDLDRVPIPTPELIYQQNQQLSLIPVSENPQIIPTPRSISTGEGVFDPDDKLSIGYQSGLENEANYLMGKLKHLGHQIELTEDLDVAEIRLTIGELRQNELEHYQLRIEPDLISVKGSDPSGVFYGVQSVLSLWPIPGTEPVVLQSQTISDGPRFGYRGFHLDVARNFTELEAVKKVLDIMSFYKLNKLHFHLTDDEGWRLEIEDIPELTEVGAVRGHSDDERDFLFPAYGSGPFTNAPDNHGTGYYSREEFIEIIQYAAERHIEVIPEINFPGHARAAIKSMRIRGQRIQEEGRKEPNYQLHDPEDQSKYSSVQGYTDNVICPCQESVYQFIEAVVAEIVDMYQQAGVKLTSIHTGGDEVPSGIWERSPMCLKFLEKNPQIDGIEGISNYFLRRYQEILAQQDLITAGWEEIAMRRAGNELVPNPEMIDNNLRPYVWNSNWGSHHDLAYKLANLGYQVVLCNANNLYFDFAYSKDPQEPGFYWSGLVNTRKPFELVPLDVLKTGTVDIMGNPLDLGLYDNYVALAPEAKNNVLGIQGQLWSETVKGSEMLEYYLFPKMIGLSERAWAPDPEWANLPKRSERLAALEVAWNSFANILAQRELVRLDHMWDEVNYRVPPPGAVIENGQLLANSAFPGLEIRYTLDGTEPNGNSPQYSEPVAAKKPVRLKAFTKTGKSSRTSVLSY
jgi:hexosaminidase